MTELPKTCGECEFIKGQLCKHRKAKLDVFHVSGHLSPPPNCPLRPDLPTGVITPGDVDDLIRDDATDPDFATPDYYNLSGCADLYEWNHKNPHSPAPVFEAITKCLRIGHPSNSRDNIRDAKAAIRALERYVELEGE